MAFLSALILLLLLLVISSSTAESHREISIAIRVADQSQREFDYFLLALQWPGTVCQETKQCCHSNGCCTRWNATSEFTIHGLWTNYNDGTWPACCNGAKKFNIKEITSLLGGLKKYWPTLTCSPFLTCDNVKGLFWAHEWEKHGTCSFPIFHDEYSYFFATLNLYLKYNITEILTKEGYIPSNSEKYPLGGIVSAIQNAVRATPKLVCANGAVQELYLCFYKNFKPRDCDDGNASSSCPRYISLPKHLPLSLEGKRSLLWSANSEAP